MGLSFFNQGRHHFRRLSPHITDLLHTSPSLTLGRWYLEGISSITCSISKEPSSTAVSSGLSDIRTTDSAWKPQTDSGCEVRVDRMRWIHARKLPYTRISTFMYVRGHKRCILSFALQRKPSLPAALTAEASQDAKTTWVRTSSRMINP